MNIFFLELRILRRSTIISTIAISAFIFAMLAFFPSMQNESMQALANVKIQGIDPALLAALGLTEMLDFSVVTNFFGYVMQFLVLALMTVVTQQAVNLILKEESDGTIEFLYAKPVSRQAILAQKLLAHVATLILMLVVFWGATVVGYLIFTDYSLAEALKECAIFYGATLFVGLIFSSVGLLLSTLLRRGVRASGVTIALVFGTFILGVLAAISEKLSFLIWLSPMDWIKTQKLMTDGILLGEWVAGISVILLAVAAAFLRYRKKDLLV